MWALLSMTVALADGPSVRELRQAVGQPLEGRAVQGLLSKLGPYTVRWAYFVAGQHRPRIQGHGFHATLAPAGSDAEWHVLELHLTREWPHPFPKDWTPGNTFRVDVGRVRIDGRPATLELSAARLEPVPRPASDGSRDERTSGMTDAILDALGSTEARQIVDVLGIDGRTDSITEEAIEYTWKPLGLTLRFEDDVLVSAAFTTGSWTSPPSVLAFREDLPRPHFAIPNGGPDRYEWTAAPPKTHHRDDTEWQARSVREG